MSDFFKIDSRLLELAEKPKRIAVNLSQESAKLKLITTKKFSALLSITTLAKAFLPVLPVTVMMTAAAKFLIKYGARFSEPKILLFAIIL